MEGDEQGGHDDFLISVALCTEAVKALAAPVQETIIIQPRRLYHDGHF
jgi:hypothetical protein